MIEKTILDYLAEQMSPIPVYMETPENVPQKYYLLQKTASGTENHINRATFAIQSISSESLLEAATMNEDIKIAIGGIIYAADISKAELNSDYNFTNSQTKEYRYQAVYNFVY